MLTMPVMKSKKKATPKTGSKVNRTPSRMVRIPESLAVHVDRLVEEDIGTDFTEHVKNALREYLQRRSKLPSGGTTTTP